jgi:hypothetical protein
MARLSSKDGRGPQMKESNMVTKNIDRNAEEKEKKTAVAKNNHSLYHGLVVSTVCTSAESVAAIAGSVVHYNPNASIANSQ